MAKRKSKLILLILGTSLIALILAGVCFFKSLPVASKELDVKFIIGSNYGLDLNKTALTFGKIVQGGSVTRAVEIKNDYNFPVKVRVFLSDNIAPFVSADSGFILNSGKNISLLFNAYVPSNASYGEYEGKVRISLYRM